MEAVEKTVSSGEGHIVLGAGTYTWQETIPNRIELDGHERHMNRVYAFCGERRLEAFVDVGANRGQTLGKALHYFPHAAYVGFEPQLEAASFVKRFLTENNLQDKQIFALALSNVNGPIQLLQRKGNPSDFAPQTASMIPGFRPASFYNASTAAYGVVGDEILAEVVSGRIGAIKIDCEGAELEVIQGLANTLDTFRPILIFEVLNHYLRMTGQKLDAATRSFRETRVQLLESALRSRGYRIYQVLPSGNAIEVEAIRPRSVKHHLDTGYVALSQEEEPRFRQFFGM